MSTLEAATRYVDDLGWSVIPMRLDAAKKPVGRWKRYQQQRPSGDELKHWFGNGRAHGIAVVFGDVSGGLASRDFDKLASYEDWARRYHRLASTLPTVETRRGRHVYCRFAADDAAQFRAQRNKPDGTGAIDIGDGELRLGSGCYSVLPPSRLPDGFEYRWLNPVSGELPLLRIDQTGFQYCYTEDVEDTGLLRELKTLATDDSSPSSDNSWSVWSVPSNESKTEGGEPISCLLPSEWSTLTVSQQVELAIAHTIPQRPGQRHRAIFEFARWLKAIPELAATSPKDLVPYLREWHQRARPYIKTKAFEETRLDFLEAWGKVKHAKGSEPIVAIFEQALKADLPECALEYEQEQLRLLVGFCRELQRASKSKPFYLACRAAEPLLGVSHAQVNRWLRLLCHDGILAEVSKGERSKRVASTYRYLPPL